MRMKRIVSAVLCLILALALLPKVTLAAVTALQIGGVDLPAGKYWASNGTGPQDDAPASGGYAHRSGDGNTLSLHNLQLDYTSATAANPYGIYVQGDLALELHGASNIFARSNAGNIVIGMAVYGDLTVTGDGGSSLTVTGENNTGIYVDGDLSVTSGSLTGKGIAGGCTGVFVSDNITVSGTGSLAGESGKANGYNGNPIRCYGIDAESITVSDNGRLEGRFTGIDETSSGFFTCTGVGIHANRYGGGGTITVNGGTLLASAVKNATRNATCTDATKALDPALTLGAGIAAAGSVNTDGANPVAYAAAENAAYRWVKAPAPVIVDGLDIPATGDGARPALWLGILLMAGAALAGSGVLRRGKRKTEN